MSYLEDKNICTFILIFSKRIAKENMLNWLKNQAYSNHTSGYEKILNNLKL